MNRKKKGAVLSALLLLIMSVALLLMTLEKDNLIIYFGIASYRTLRTVLLAAEGASLLLFVICCARSMKKEKKPEAAVSQDDKSPALSVKERLQNDSLRKILSQEASGRWKALSGELSETGHQLEQMDTYQERLHTLLQENDIKALSDTEEVLEQAEQGLCQNVRKIINYMSVFDDKDVELLRASVQASNEKNREQLTQVRDFVVAVTDFVNQQGTVHQDPDLLNTYKSMILETLKEES